MQRLAVTLETAVYGWIDLVAERGGGVAPGDDPLASPLTLAVPDEMTQQDALSQAS
jgi:hypothetical protein